MRAILLSKDVDGVRAVTMIFDYMICPRQLESCAWKETVTVNIYFKRRVDVNIHTKVMS
jgi:hypothetical protein